LCVAFSVFAAAQRGRLGKEGWRKKERKGEKAVAKGRTRNGGGWE